MMRKAGVALMFFAVLFVLSSPLFAEEVPLLQQLKLKLQEKNWTQAQIQEMIQAANKLNWEGTDPGDAEIVALSLQLCQQEREQVKAEEQARIALQIALAAREMEQAGLGERDIARACLDCTRDMLQDRDQLRTRDRIDADGDRLQEQVRDTIRTQIRVSSGEQGGNQRVNGNNASNGPSGMGRK